MALTKQQLEEALAMVALHGLEDAAAELGLSKETLRYRHRRALEEDVSISNDTTASAVSREEILENRIVQMQRQLKASKKDTLSLGYVKENIFKFTEAAPIVPKWTLKPKNTTHNPGVPTLLATDWHYGEVVNPSEIHNANEYNLEIADERIRLLTENTISLLRSHVVRPNYPGLVLCLGGDIFSGDIHQELTETNAETMLQLYLRIQGQIQNMINAFVKEFGHVHVVGVAGNHGRTSMRPRAKWRAYTNFDWLLYKQVERHYRNDKRITFNIPDGPDAFFQIYNHRYCLTHGDQARGGDGQVGFIGPVRRMMLKKRAYYQALGIHFDTMLHGHFHSDMFAEDLISGPSLKGGDEYSAQGNFPYARPAQTLWFTHPSRGLTFRMPVLLEKKTEPAANVEWIS